MDKVQNGYVPGLKGVPATESAISFLDGQVGLLTYRGFPIVDLARFSSFEETAWILINGGLPETDELARFDAELRANRRVKYNVRDIMKFLPIDGHPMEALQTCVASLGMFYPGQERMTANGVNADSEFVEQMIVKILASMATLVAMWEHIRRGDDPVQPRTDLTYAENFLYMMNEREPDPVEARIMDACLVLHAEHTINASTFSALVCGSTLAPPNLVVASAIGTLAGPLHGGANQRVLNMLDEIGSVEKVSDWLDQRLANKQVVWGFGHREYKVKDPRADILQGLLEQLREHRSGQISPLYEIAMALERCAEERLAPKGIFPNVDFYSGLLYEALGIPRDQFTPIFAISRTAGWLAHWKEQIANNRIFRPTQIYQGYEPRSYQPMSSR
ncbi:citrate synthase [Halothiobacillus neapolitanus]|jgi:citrate synthase|uniref:Citrate synthase n=1 Tax=Halothiobacillus neapolitanus (strain ATCC 23641 / DSM 15147 / CIP 104769 / NCIMB 8539 / c2) TaxID=555778 RepID=D0KW55_HALNC|nr:citrate synthase [Halothiobacillus neapolitanus]ACX96958.1 Citrate (Si)-synthase [Halothiobacillus neapolitanus c2]OZB83370.1 MAG: citrate synthase [Halothiobacillus sp. 13-55-253]TDN59825.1 citrate synthase [Halothiobacillus neapolitanus]